VTALDRAASVQRKKYIQKRRSNMKSTTGFCAMTLIAASFLFMPPANAQDKSPSAPQSPSTPSLTAPGSPTAPANIPDNKLDAAAAAVKSVSAIKDTFDHKLAQVPDAEKERLAGEANSAITKAVTDQGLSIEEFATIIKVAQNDPIVREKLLKRMK
jgi:hypothetical protein